jgi:hypothetical protein
MTLTHPTPTPAPRFVVLTASARCSAKYGIYRRVAVVEAYGVSSPDQIKMISSRARGVLRVVKTWERLNVGRTEKCAYRRALNAAEELAAVLNDQFLENNPELV